MDWGVLKKQYEQTQWPRPAVPKTRRDVRTAKRLCDVIGHLRRKIGNAIHGHGGRFFGQTKNGTIGMGSTVFANTMV